jgi:hypothetical protein
VAKVTNSQVKKVCPVCTSEFETYSFGKSSKTTCSYACANSFFRSGKSNGRRARAEREGKENFYRICWENHKRECIICGEQLIVAVHHYNENHDDNRPENLVPMCPTHHQYWHSSHRHLIQDRVDDFVSEFIRKIQ